VELPLCPLVSRDPGLRAKQVLNTLLGAGPRGLPEIAHAAPDCRGCLRFTFWPRRMGTGPFVAGFNFSDEIRHFDSIGENSKLEES